MTDDEKENPKGNSGRKKPSSSSQLLPLALGVGEKNCGCIARMPRPCARNRKKLGADLSEEELQYVRITHVITM
eukprot:scaffold7233_cov63-Attheya_sp.AAC.7